MIGIWLGILPSTYRPGHKLVKEETRDGLSQTMTAAGGNSLVTVPVQATSPSPWRRKRVWVFLLGSLAFGLTLLFWGFGGGGGAWLVPVETLAPGPVQRVLAVSGRTATDVHSDIVSSVSARVLSVKADEGDVVETGALLLVLDDTQQKATVRQALAALDAALLAQQSAQSDRDRAITLGVRVSPVAVADAERALALAILEVDSVEAVLDRAQLALPDYKISAPIAGVVLSRSIEAGDLATPSHVLMRLANKNNLHVEVQIDEIYTDAIRVGEQAQIQLAGRTEVATGIVSFVASEVDELTGSMRVKLSFDTPPDARIGLTAVANILIDEVADALTVPRSAFVENGAQTAVFILRDGRANLSPITYIDWPAERVEVTSGLSSGDMLVLSTEGVKDGQLLKRQNSQSVRD